MCTLYVLIAKANMELLTEHFLPIMVNLDSVYRKVNVSHFSPQLHAILIDSASVFQHILHVGEKSRSICNLDCRLIILEITSFCCDIARSVISFPG
ncbi:unnamed protein product [Onchocerca flexuosa]|uniref:Secreted protein n=1 Tax=Onchocerca flexuosa TaxID=387005 RepID=A0A183I2X7_9BILA|nr:unnamed protein product [Onchocerca flexuosa]